MQLNQRQERIIDIIKQFQPITGELIAEKLGVTRAALRSDLAVLSMLGIIDAKPKVGYFYLGQYHASIGTSHFEKMTVSEIMGIPLTVHQKDSVYDVIVHIFMEDAGCAFILDDDDFLCGVVSRKDLLKTSIGGGDLSKMPIGMVMTRMPHVTTVLENESLFAVADKLVSRKVDSLPVVRRDKQYPEKFKVIGKLSKTILASLFLEIRDY
ncbi:helix-turn-helix transcriptional regulator [Streptococcus agalactiae]|nr:helix-turn-helix transcriptional regulator [Streptococcus agalactiae]WMI55350.1 helix-turn-helix transcriptional regulator [Streptococcus agalactiae]